MLTIFSKDTPSMCSVLYRGNIPPRPEEYEFLTRQGVALKSVKVGDFAHWGLAADHPTWGDAQIVCLKESRLPEEAIALAPGLTDEERVQASNTKLSITIRVPAKQKTVLKDRKCMLRYMRAVMADDAVIGVDNQSLLGWSRARLDDELMHDADLDIDSLFATHSVLAEGHTEDNPRVDWLHTHGLGELGAFDFDLIRPHQDLVSRFASDFTRALAFAILEGDIAHDQPSFQIGEPSPTIRMVPVDQYMAGASPADREPRDDPHSAHVKRRSVVCEPGARSFLGFGKPKIIPNRAISKPLGERGMFRFSAQATRIMEQRARQTLHLVPLILDELREFEPQCIAKIGYRVDAGADGENEHMWFEVHAVTPNGLDATLQVQPFSIARMKLGDRAVHPVDHLTDWMIMLPFGSVTPRSFAAWRFAKTNRAALAEIMKSAAAQSAAKSADR